jgi:hypothetical protein
LNATLTINSITDNTFTCTAAAAVTTSGNVQIRRSTDIRQRTNTKKY